VLRVERRLARAGIRERDHDGGWLLLTGALRRTFLSLDEEGMAMVEEAIKTTHFQRRMVAAGWVNFRREKRVRFRGKPHLPDEEHQVIPGEPFDQRRWQQQQLIWFVRSLCLTHRWSVEDCDPIAFYNMLPDEPFTACVENYCSDKLLLDIG